MHNAQQDLDPSAGFMQVPRPYIAPAPRERWYRHDNPNATTPLHSRGFEMKTNSALKNQAPDDSVDCGSWDRINNRIAKQIATRRADNWYIYDVMGLEPQKATIPPQKWRVEHPLELLSDPQCYEPILEVRVRKDVFETLLIECGGAGRQWPRFIDPYAAGEITLRQSKSYPNDKLRVKMAGWMGGFDRESGKRLRFSQTTLHVNIICYRPNHYTLGSPRVLRHHGDPAIPMKQSQQITQFKSHKVHRQMVRQGETEGGEEPACGDSE